MEKADACYDRARILFLEGKSIKEISRTLPVSARTLRRWRLKGDWEAHGCGPTLSNRRTLEILRVHLDKKIQELDKGITSSDVNEIAKISASIERMERAAGDMRGPAVEIMDLYTRYLKSNFSPEEVEKQARIIHSFIQYLEETL
jgi:hypothetical protein